MYGLYGRAAVGSGRVAHSAARLRVDAPTTMRLLSTLAGVRQSHVAPIYLADDGGAGWLIARRTYSSAAAVPCTAAVERALEPEPSDMRLLRALRMHPEQYVATEGFNKAWLLPACIANHASLGAIFAWSVLNQPLLRLNGVVAPSAADWSLGDINVTFSLVMGGFLWGAVFGGFHDRWGPRACCLIGATAIGGGFGLASLAVATDNLLMLKAGGLVWGLSMGWAYVPPLANVIRWYPDKKGFASSAVVVGYGAGAFIAAPVFYNLLKAFQRVPTYLGTRGEVELVNREGRMFASVVDTAVDVGGAGSSSLVEVIVATTADINAAGFVGIPEGVYVVGTGSTGGAETFGLMGLAYTAIIASTAYMHRLPRADVGVSPGSSLPTRSTTADSDGAVAPLPSSSFNVDPAVAIRTPQFWAMYAGFGLSITGAYGVISSGRLMLTECFGETLPHIVTPANTAAFVGLMSIGNLGGRLFWANGSDIVAQRMGGDPFWGRKATFAVMWGLGPAAYLGTAYAISANAANPSAVYLGVFTGGVCYIMSSFGGSVALRPPICGDLFGIKSVGLMSAYQLSVVAPASFVGPQLVAYFRNWSVNDAIEDLCSQVSPEKFRDTFGAGHETLPQLVEAKTVTINRLLELVPDGTPDPTPFVYDRTMYTMAALYSLAFLTNATLRPVNPSLHSKGAALLGSRTPQTKR